MPNLPSGTVTFAFSDIEGSTALLKRLGDEGYRAVLATHRRIVRETFAAHDGQEIDTQGDAFFYSFPRARQAVTAAVEVQRAHEQEEWPDGAAVRVRIGLHTGEPVVGEEGYTGLDVVRAARIAAVGQGGQVLLSDTTRALLGAEVPDGVEVSALGPHRLKDIDQPESLHELRIDGVTVDPAAPRRDEGRRQRPAPTAPPGPTGPFIPDVSAILKTLPDFVRDAASKELSGAGSARETIEQRVLADLQESLSADRRPDRKRKHRDRRAPAEPSLAPGPAEGSATEKASQGGSVATEIERLHALRTSGALTEEQYRQAVERVVSKGS